MFEQTRGVPSQKLPLLMCVFLIGLPISFGCGSGKKPEANTGTSTAASQNADPDYQEGYQYASSVLESASNAPASQKRGIMKQLEPDQIGKKPRAFWKGVSTAMKDFEVRLANGSSR